MAENILDITQASITNGAGRVSARIDNSTDLKRSIRFLVVSKSGAAAPDAGSTYKYYFHRQDDGTPSHSDDTVGEVDAVMSVEPDNSKLAGELLLEASGDKVFETSFEVNNPGSYWSMSYWNASGQTNSTTEGDHYIRWIYLD